MEEVKQQSLSSDQPSTGIDNQIHSPEVNKPSIIKKIINIVGIPTLLFIIFSLIIFPLVFTIVSNVISESAHSNSGEGYWFGAFIATILGIFLFFIAAVISAVIVLRRLKKLRYAILAFLILPAIFVFNITGGFQ